MQIYDYKVVKINAEVVDGKLVLDATGPLAIAAKPILTKMNAVFQDEKPISVTDDEIIFSTWIPPIPGPVFNRLLRSQIEFSLLIRERPIRFLSA
jgi:hypothetical protein